jgi:hypothetical protein
MLVSLLEISRQMVGEAGCIPDNLLVAVEVHGHRDAITLKARDRLGIYSVCSVRGKLYLKSHFS